MSTTETPDQIHVVVLHSEQPLTVDLAELHPDCRVTVLTDGVPNAVSEGTEAPDVVSMPRSEWADQLARWAKGGEVDVVSRDESLQHVCAELRSGLGLPPNPTVHTGHATPANR
ncbi:hypothetical protein [Nocardiopsis metallicus]|uniref:Uncharacterized protein n=1 Tax=Nocardiopsis metallicus TaxID=179819 RepID=A0A840VY77_9ACTN|nr:hypothetical protein [Nocardiopsis metallicus]MBB5489430.1 hypothetical protein [Nocardiopsis metallicus]